MKKYLAAIMTGLLLLGSSPALFAGSSRSVEEKRMQADYQKRKAETKAYREKYKKDQDALMKGKKEGKKSKFLFWEK
ncbi:MAG: hypothetical protein ACHQYQ_07685 [Bacteriovoracales bacterium]